MPIRINENMPVVGMLQKENIFIMGENRASHQDIRELKIAIVNIMPEKESAELQLLRLLSNSPLQTEITFVRMDSHKSKNSTEEYLRAFYKSFSEIKYDYFDGMIITGAPVENMPFEQVDYWDEISQIMQWSNHHVTSTMYICWASQAGLYYHYGIDKFRFPEKLSGIYRHRRAKLEEDLLRGFDDVFNAPHSRHTGVRREDILAHPELQILAESKVAGAFLILDKNARRIFVCGHPEYSADTLAKEYFRDIDRGLNPKLPVNYFPDDDPTQEPVTTWRCQSNLLFSNWLNYYVYQDTPFRLEDIEMMYTI